MKTQVQIQALRDLIAQLQVLGVEDEHLTWVIKVLEWVLA